MPIPPLLSHFSDLHSQHGWNLEIDLDDFHLKDSHAIHKIAFPSLSKARILRHPNPTLEAGGRAVRLHD